ncbi:MAG: sigma-70 family RNA polymerase sigma factor [Planctomycetes bacterium]|nr:sigma-70 family RNA polymerase sigma factor [Planctomycetota bacterium]
MNTTLAVQRLLDDLGDRRGPPADPVIRELLVRSVDRLQFLCARLLRRHYPRLTRRPAYLDTGDVLGALTGRLLRALDEVKPHTVRQFFALANKHLRWELNDIARRIDSQPIAHAPVLDPADPQPPTSTGEGATLHRILQAIEALPEEEREVFELVRLQGLTHAEAATALEVAEKTVQRRLRRGLLLLSETLGDLVADDDAAPDAP